MNRTYIKREDKVLYENDNASAAEAAGCIGFGCGIVLLALAIKVGILIGAVVLIVWTLDWLGAITL